MKKFFSLLALAAVAILVAAALPVVAMAQEQGTTIDLGSLLAPWLEMLIGAVAILVTAILGYLAALIKRKTGVDIDLARMTTLQTAITNAAGLVINKLGDAAEGKTIDVRHPLIRDAILYVNAAAPDAVAQFGLSGEQIAEKIAAKLGLATAPAPVPVTNNVTVKQI